MTSIEQIRERHDEYQGDLEMIMHEAEACPEGEYSGDDYAHKDRATLLAVIEQVEKLQVYVFERLNDDDDVVEERWIGADAVEELLK